ncbi:hypothetical protein LDENG_00153660, partial [Lucifuga dentata]
NIARLHPSLTQHITEVLVNLLVISCINCINTILSGIPNKLLHQLQLIQNSAVRIITLVRCSFSSTASLCRTG